MNECLIKYEIFLPVKSIVEIEIKPCCDRLCEETIKDQLLNHMNDDEEDFIKHVNTLFPCECGAKLKLSRIEKRP